MRARRAVADAGAGDARPRCATLHDEAVGHRAGTRSGRRGARRRRRAAQRRRAGAPGRGDAGRDAARAASDAAAVTASSYAVLTAPFDGIVTERPPILASMADAGHRRCCRSRTRPRSGWRCSSTKHGRRRRGRPGDADVADSEIPPDPRGRRGARRRDRPRRSRVAQLSGEARSAGGRRRCAPACSAAPRFPGPARRALTVPASALVRRGQLTFVYIVDGEHRARLRPVSTGGAAGDRVEVLAGSSRGRPS